MNKSTSKFKATGLGMPSVINYSDAPAKSAGKRFASDTRSWKALGPDGTAPDAQKKVVTKANLPMLPRGGTKSHPNLDVKSEPSPATYGAGSAKIGAPKSGEKNLSPAVDALPTKWHKGGKYSMNVPSDLSGAPRLKKKWSKA